MTLPEQAAKALPVKVAKAINDLMAVAHEVQQEFAEASTREKPLPQTTTECKWITSAGKETYIGDMHDHHVRNSLAKIKNNLDKGMVAYLGEDGTIKFADRMRHLADNKEVFLDDNNHINTF